MKKLLINYIYWSPVGHAVEALKFSKGFAKANPDLEIHMALSKYTPTELTEACSWIRETYIIDLFEFVEEKEKYDSLKHIPREWDYVMTNELMLRDKENSKHFFGKEDKGAVNYLNYSNDYFKTKIGKGRMFGAARPELPEGLDYNFDSKVELSLPKEAIVFANKYKHNGPTITLLMGGSAGYSYYPDVESWIKIIEQLNKNIGNIKIYLTGIKESKGGRTNTQAYSDVHIKKVLDTFDNVIDCYNIGLWNQLALMEQSDIFISPHTGFAFLAPCVGTPWLAISGGNWPEYFFNHVPFYSVLPDNPDYPYLGELDINKYNNEGKIICMLPEKLEKKIPEVVEGVKLLLDDSFTYEDALERHKENISRSIVRKDKIPKGPGF